MLSLGATAATRVTEKPLRRFPDWEQRLQRWINQAQNRTWMPGIWDCCQAPAEAVREMTGVDVGARTRGRCETLEGQAAVVMRLHHDAGIRTFEDAVAAEWVFNGLVGSTPGMARRGDIVMFDQPPPHGPTWGIVDLSGQRFVAAGRDGLMWGPVERCRRAWRVG